MRRKTVIFGRSGGTQTRGLRIPNAAPYRLGYTPKYEILIFDRRFSCGRRYGLSCGRAESPEMKTSRFRAFSRLLNHFCEAIVGFPGLYGNGREFSYTLPNQALPTALHPGSLRKGQPRAETV